MTNKRNRQTETERNRIDNEQPTFDYGHITIFTQLNGPLTSTRHTQPLSNEKSEQVSSFFFVPFLADLFSASQPVVVVVVVPAHECAYKISNQLSKYMR